MEPATFVSSAERGGNKEEWLHNEHRSYEIVGESISTYRRNLPTRTAEYSRRVGDVVLSAAKNNFEGVVNVCCALQVREQECTSYPQNGRQCWGVGILRQEAACSFKYLISECSE